MALLLRKLNFLHMFDSFQMFVISPSTEILIELHFWLGMYSQNHPNRILCSQVVIVSIRARQKDTFFNLF